MMLTLLFMLLYLGKVVLADQHTCDKGSFKTCAKANTFPVTLPENEEDLDKLCPIILEFTQCTWDHEEACSPEIEMAESRRHFEGLQSILEDICREGSSLHKAVSENAKCLKISILEQNATCYEPSERALELYTNEALKAFNESVRKQITQETLERWENYICFFHVYDISCLAGDADRRCGSAAKYIILEMVRRVGYLEFVCPSELLDELPALVELLELEEEEKKHLREILSEK